MAKELIIGPRFKKSKDNPNLLIHHFDKNYTVTEMSLDVMSRQILLTMVKKPKQIEVPKLENPKKPKKAKPKKK